MSVFVYIHEYEMTGQSFVLLANLPHDNNFLRHGNVSDREGSVYTNGCVGHGISILIKGHLKKLSSAYFKNYVLRYLLKDFSISSELITQSS